MHNSFHMQDSTPKFVYCNKKKRALYFLEVEVIWIESFLCRGSELFSFVICLLFDYRILIRITDNLNVLFSDEQYFQNLTWFELTQ